MGIPDMCDYFSGYERDISSLDKPVGRFVGRLLGSSLDPNPNSISTNSN
jgi:hypothetical protein